VVAYIAIEACRALAYAHDRTDRAGNPINLVHRDVSPQNVLISFSGEIKLADFGIAKVTNEAISLTGSGKIRGKFNYMSPEQARAAPIDRRSDLFTLGIVIYELLTRRRLYSAQAKGPQELLEQIGSFRGIDAKRLADLPESFRPILRTALQGEPIDRFPDAASMEAALTAMLGPDGILLARHSLAFVMQRLFQAEWLEESAPDRASPEASVEAKPAAPIQTDVSLPLVRGRSVEVEEAEESPPDKTRLSPPPPRRRRHE
jgi:serine/threonine-protein kinase